MFRIPFGVSHALESHPTSAPQPRLRPTCCHLSLPMLRPSQAPMCHGWPGWDLLCLPTCVLLVRPRLRAVPSFGAPFSTDQICLVRFRPRLRADPLRLGGNIFSFATADSAADLHMIASLAAVSPTVADLLASLWATTANLAIICAFVSVCAPPTSQAIGGRHCS